MISRRLTTLLAFERLVIADGASSGSAAQQSVPVAVAEPDAATAEGFPRAVIELVFKTAMVGAVKATAEGVVGAMVAEPPWQRRRILPVRLNERRVRRQFSRLRRRTDRGPGNEGEERERKGFHRQSTAKGGETKASYNRMRAKESSGNRRRVHRRSRLDHNRRPFLDRQRALDRQTYGEAGAFPFPALHLDAAAVQIDGHLDQIEAETGSYDSRNVAATVIALEQTFEVAGGNAESPVGDSDDDVIRNDLGVDFDCAATRRVLDGIGQQIAENLK